MNDPGGILSVAEAVSFEGLPAAYRTPLRRYIREGVLPAPPVRAVLEGKLPVAIALDRGATMDLCKLAEWVEQSAPASCHGSRAQVQLWMVYMRRARGQQLLASLGSWPLQVPS